MSGLISRASIQAPLAQERIVEILTAATAAISGVLAILVVATAS